MSMRWNIAIIVMVLVIMSVIAAMWQPDLDLKGRKPLVWTTDPNPQRDGQVTAFNKMYPDHKLRIDTGNSQSDKVITQCSANMGPDIIDHVTPGSTFQLYHNAGVLRDITEDAKKMGFGPDTLPPAVRSLIMLRVMDKDGEIVKRQFIYPCNIAHSFIILNKNVFKKYGVSIPKGDVSWDQIIKIAKKINHL